jgi:DNA-binding NtrC family response regulator
MPPIAASSLCTVSRHLCMDPTRPRLLVIDDDPAILALIGTVALAEGFEVITVGDGAALVPHLRQPTTDLVLVDVRVPATGGLDVLRTIRGVNPRCHIVVMSGHATIDAAVEAVKLGALDYLSKPFDTQRLRRLLAAVRSETGRRRGRHAGEGRDSCHVEFCGMIGGGPAMQEVFGLIRRVAPHAHVALVTGETGTGKELVARALHRLGPRSSRRFITVNCSAVVEGLFESELFGHLRGAFTGATDYKAGLLEVADGGTLFLDEVAELPASVQGKLLRVIENGEVQRVGSVEPRKVDVRLVAATNRDLQVDVAAGRFRGDLYYRLNIAEIRLPPLRQRREDIPALAATFVRTFAQRFGKPLLGLTPEAERRLIAASWDGNVRQLRNVLERACMLADGELVTDADLACFLEQPIRPEEVASVAWLRRNPSVALQQLERDHIVKTLEGVGGNKAVAARLLGVSRRALYRQLERHGLHRRLPAEPRGPIAGAIGRVS